MPGNTTLRLARRDDAESPEVEAVMKEHGVEALLLGIPDVDDKAGGEESLRVPHQGDTLLRTSVRLIRNRKLKFS